MHGKKFMNKSKAPLASMALFTRKCPDLQPKGFAEHPLSNMNVCSLRYSLVDGLPGWWFARCRPLRIKQVRGRLSIHGRRRTA